MKLTTQLEQLLAAAACVLAVLLLIFYVRMILLRRSLRRLEAARLKTESELAAQQQEVITIRQDSQAWRGEMQRQFDAFRSDATRRHGEAELRAQDVQKRLDSTVEKHERSHYEMQTELEATKRMCVELPSTKARVIELEKMLATAPQRPAEPESASLARNSDTPAPNSPAVDALPMLPAVDALTASAPVTPIAPESDEPAVSSLDELRRKNAEIQRALYLARRGARGRRPARKMHRSR